MAATQRVKHITLHFSGLDQCPDMTEYPNAWKNLSTLRITHQHNHWLVNERGDGKRALSRLLPLLHRNMETLEHLSTFMPGNIIPWCIQMLPDLKRLRILDLVTNIFALGVPGDLFVRMPSFQDRSNTDGSRGGTAYLGQPDTPA